eukprot:GSMAST32.ASY1.ANO1.2456.1 assembled CDS
MPREEYSKTMVRYSTDPTNTAKSAKARGSNLRVHYKNCREVGACIKGLPLLKAIKYLEDVREFKRAIAFRRYTGGCGRNAQETKGLEVDSLYLTHVQVNRAPKMRRRTYRAHGRIGAYMASPAHIEVIVEEKTKAVPKAAPTGRTVRHARKALAQKRLRSGGGH